MIDLMLLLSKQYHHIDFSWDAVKSSVKVLYGKKEFQGFIRNRCFDGVLKVSSNFVVYTTRVSDNIKLVSFLIILYIFLSIIETKER